MKELHPDMMVMSPTMYHSLKAAMDNQGRDWRRVKREIRKAMKRAKNEQAQ